MSKARSWVFTLNNYTEIEILQIQGIDCKFVGYGKEVGEDKHTPHLQGMIMFKNAVRMATVKEALGDRAHIEPMKGSPKQAWSYCLKDGETWHKGDEPKPGKRTDLAAIKAVVAAGGHMTEVIEAATSYQDMRSGELILKYQKSTKLRQQLVVHWWYGPTGCSKTWSAIQAAGDDYWISGKTLEWWEGYQGQKKVIIDDFRPDFCTFHELLRILDIYPYRVPFKGSSTWLNADEIWITCPSDPTNTWQSKTTEDLQQLVRRISDIREFNVPWHRAGTEVGVILSPTPVPRPAEEPL